MAGRESRLRQKDCQEKRLWREIPVMMTGYLYARRESDPEDKS
jgi:hypothetical protein